MTGRVDTTSTYQPRNQTTPRQPGGEYPHGRGSRLTGHPPLRGERVRQRGAPRIDADRPARARPDPQLPAAAAAAPRPGPGACHRVRQVPRPHARGHRRVRAVLYRLGGRDRHPRPRARRRGSGRPGGPRYPWRRRVGPIRRRRGQPDRPDAARVRRLDGRDPGRTVPDTQIAPRIPGGRSMLMMLAPVRSLLPTQRPYGPEAEDPVTRLVTGSGIPRSNLLETSVRSLFRDRRPRCCPRFDRGSA